MSGGFFTPPNKGFGAPAGNAAATNTGFNFGTPAANTGFSFAAPAQNAPSPGFNFNSPAAQPANTAVAPTAQGSGFNFNSPTISSTNPAPAFGSMNMTPTNSAAAPAFGMGNAAAATSQTAFGGLGGTPNLSAPQFGLPAATSSSTGFGGLGGSTPKVPPPSFTATVGAAAATGQSAFGGFNTPAQNAATTTSGFGINTAKTTGFNFGSTVPTLTGTTSASLNFGTTTTTATLGTFAGATSAAPGMFGAKATINQSSIGMTGGSSLFNNQLSTVPGQLPLTAITPAPAPFLGLGGTDLNSNQPKSSVGKTDNVKVKDIIIPAPIAETVENIKSFIKQQKAASSDIARATIRKITNVSDEIKTLEWSLQDISNCVEKNYRQIKVLRAETSTILQSVEMAQRTLETSVGLQFENTMPLNFFQELVQKYESDVLAFRHQVELTEKHIGSLANPQSFTPDDLKRGMKQIHESFVALAGRLHEIHQKVETQKEHYLNLRKYYLRDTHNVFSELETKTNEIGVSNISSGPTPFSSLSAAAATVSFQNRSIANRNLGGFTGAGPAGQSLMTVQDHNNSGMMSNLNAQKPLFSSTTFGNTAPTGFNLQTPPLGAKRNKQ